MMTAAPSDADQRAVRPWLRRSWDGPDVVRFYAGSPFSNFARSPIWLPCPLDGDVLVEHPTVEHAFQAAKATSWPDFRSVWFASTPAEAKRIGQWEIRARPDWESHRFHAMLAALRAKYRIPRFREALLATGDRPLAEDSPSDFEWGARDGHGGYTGRNYLGRALMRVRDEIRRHPPGPAADPSGERALLRHPTLAEQHGRSQAGDRARIEREVLERCERGSIPWRAAGRDTLGRLVLVADVGAGTRRPGQQRRVSLTVDPAGLIYRDEVPRPASSRAPEQAADAARPGPDPGEDYAGHAYPAAPSERPPGSTARG
jgi:ribA/ribD-fused uncharacterized protein